MASLLTSSSRDVSNGLEYNKMYPYEKEQDESEKANNGNADDDDFYLKTADDDEDGKPLIRGLHFYRMRRIGVSRL